MGLGLSLIFFFMALFGEALWLRILGLLMFVFLLFIGILTYKTSERMLKLEIKKDEVSFSSGNGDGKSVKKDEIKKIAIFHVFVGIPDSEIEDEYYVLSIDTGKEDYRYLPGDANTTKMSDSIQKLIKSLEEMGKNVEVVDVVIDKPPKNRQEFLMEYPEKYGHERK